MVVEFSLKLLRIAFSGRFVLVLFNLLVVLRQSVVYRGYSRRNVPYFGRMFPWVKLYWYIKKYPYPELTYYRDNILFGLSGKLNIDEVTLC
jgi:hypothetical protein